MRKIEVREAESSSGAAIATILIGAVAGVVVGMYIAQSVGGFSGLAAKLRPRRRSGETRADAYYEAAGEDYADEDLEDDEELAEDDLDEAESDEFDDQPEGDAPVLEE